MIMKSNWVVHFSNQCSVVFKYSFYTSSIKNIETAQESNVFIPDMLYCQTVSLNMMGSSINVSHLKISMTAS